MKVKRYCTGSAEPLPTNAPTRRLESVIEFERLMAALVTCVRDWRSHNARRNPRGGAERDTGRKPRRRFCALRAWVGVLGLGRDRRCTRGVPTLTRERSRLHQRILHGSPTALADAGQRRAPLV